MFKPLNNRVVIKPEEKSNTTASGIILTETSKEKPVTGTVVVGNELVQAGQRVLFSKYGFDEVEYEKETYYVVSNNTLLAIL